MMRKKKSGIVIFFAIIMLYFFAFLAWKGTKFYLYALKNLATSWDGEQSQSMCNYFDSYIVFYNLYGEQYIAGIDNNVSYFLTGDMTSTQVIAGKDKWLFYKSSIDGDPLGDYIGETRYNNEEMSTLLKRAIKKQEYWEKKGVRCLTIIPPNKENVYSEYMPENIERKSDVSKEDVMSSYLKKNNVNIINLKSEMNKSKISENYSGYNLYYKYDTHWNQLGAEVGVAQIIKYMENRSIEVKRNEIHEEQLNYHLSALDDLAVTASLKWRFHDEKDYFFSCNPNINWQKLKEDINDDGVATIHNEKAEYKKTILIVGDSFRIAMIPALSKYYNNVIITSSGASDVDYYEKYNPDCVVYEYVERYFGNELCYK